MKKALIIENQKSIENIVQVNQEVDKISDIYFVKAKKKQQPLEQED
jgi:hypothetical protein